MIHKIFSIRRMVFSERTAHILNQPYKKPEITQEDLAKSSIDNNDVLLQKIQKGQPEV